MRPFFASVRRLTVATRYHPSPALRRATLMTTPRLPVVQPMRSLHTTPAIHKPNRLIDEKSPYLLVDWYPWGRAAFEKAKAENKPIFLSIGYSTCHWCHVMEHESFENDQVAKILNEKFVSIKVDREENSGVDKLYMTYVQLTTGRGGWPMSVFLTPDLHPFFGATYFPPDDVGSHPGFKTVLSRVAKVWEDTPDALLQNGQDTIHQLRSYVQSRPRDSASDSLDADKIAKDACDHYASVYDASLGGFSDAPKFPQPVQMNFLLDYYGYTRLQQGKAETDGKDALAMVLFTLKKIAEGGIHEGAFCVWTQSELESVLDNQQAQAIIRHYGVQADGNVNPAQDPHGELVNKNVLTTQESLQETADALKMPLTELEKVLEAAKQKLWNYRVEHRPKPHRDEKILTSWNGLMMTGLVKAYQVLQDPAILDLATNTADFIHKELYRSDSKTLLRSYCQGPSAIEGFLDDYSYLIQGLLDLYEANKDERWVQWAYELQEKQNELFFDKEAGGYFTVQENDTSMVVRLKDEQDGAEPSPNAISLKNLIRLGTIMEKSDYVTHAQGTLDWSYRAMAQYPYAMPALVTSSLLMYHGVKQIVLAGNSDDKTMETYNDLVNQAFIPNKLVIQAKDSGFVHDHNSLIAKIAATSAQEQQGKPTAFVCENFTCGLPIQDATQLKKLLQN
ncbi:hypothetical protein [Absidia glauca]|uniref:Spermatogenesis-associated protein 20-like TRX domain-containing protein n=1 Tax=Absidia glauca TaxID=4829 RepID=A0A163KVW4_ABSGL|nr:hypothetical protein [Absidia glauca]